MIRNQIEAEDYHQSRVLYELCSIIINTLQFPPLPFYIPTPYSYSSAAAATSSSSASTSSPSSSSLPPYKRQPWWTTLSTSSEDSPAAFASLFLCISLALMLFGSVTFLIGFLLLPWITLLVVVLYVAALVSNLSVLGRLIFLVPPRFTRMSHVSLSLLWIPIRSYPSLAFSYFILFYFFLAFKFCLNLNRFIGCQHVVDPSDN